MNRDPAHRRWPSTLVYTLVFGLIGFSVGSSLAQESKPTEDPSPSPSPTASASEAPPAVGPVVDDACTLITQQEADQVLGAPSEVVAEGAQCLYLVPGLSARSLSVAAQGVPDEMAGEVANAVAYMTDSLGGQQFDVDDVGDEASILTSEAMSQGTAREGNNLVVVVLVAPEGTAQQQVELLSDLMRTALGRIPESS